MRICQRSKYPTEPPFPATIVAPAHSQGFQPASGKGSLCRRAVDSTLTRLSAPRTGHFLASLAWVVAWWNGEGRAAVTMSCRPSSGILAPKILIFDWDDTIFPSTFVDRHEADHFSDFPANVRGPGLGFPASVVVGSSSPPWCPPMPHAINWPGPARRGGCTRGRRSFFGGQHLTLPVRAVHRFAGTKIAK